MARPQKKGLDYFPFDVGFFDDWKIKELRCDRSTLPLCYGVYGRMSLYSIPCSLSALSNIVGVGLSDVSRLVNSVPLSV